MFGGGSQCYWRAPSHEGTPQVKGFEGKKVSNVLFPLRNKRLIFEF
jgi:hypothetical protein